MEVQYKVSAGLKSSKLLFALIMTVVTVQTFISFKCCIIFVPSRALLIHISWKTSQLPHVLQSLPLHKSVTIRSYPSHMQPPNFCCLCGLLPSSSPLLLGQIILYYQDMDVITTIIPQVSAGICVFEGQATRCRRILCSLVQGTKRSVKCGKFICIFIYLRFKTWCVCDYWGR